MYCGASGLTAPSGFCNAGYLCLGAATAPNPSASKCPAGAYCESAAVSATACPFGTFASATGGACAEAIAGAMAVSAATSATHGARRVRLRGVGVGVRGVTVAAP